MSFYKILVRGENFLVSDNGGEKLLGLFAAVYIEARTEEAAFFNAVPALQKKMRKDDFLRRIINLNSQEKERPKLFVTNILIVANPDENAEARYELCSMDTARYKIPWIGWCYLTPERSLSEYVLDVGPVKIKDNLTEVARKFIGWGYKSVSLRALSEKEFLDIDQTGALFEKGINEAGFKFPTKKQALRLLVKKYCEWAIADVRSPVAVAEMIGKDVKSMCNENDIELPELSQFEHYHFLLNADWEDDIDSSLTDLKEPNLDKEIIEEAKLYLNNLNDVDTDLWIMADSST